MISPPIPQKISNRIHGLWVYLSKWVETTSKTTRLTIQTATDSTEAQQTRPNGTPELFMPWTHLGYTKKDEKKGGGKVFKEAYLANG